MLAGLHGLSQCTAAHRNGSQPRKQVPGSEREVPHYLFRLLVAGTGPQEILFEGIPVLGSRDPIYCIGKLQECSHKAQVRIEAFSLRVGKKKTVFEC